MASSSGSGPRPPRRTPAGSRTPTSRPRKVAGRAPDEPVQPDPVLPDPVEPDEPEQRLEAERPRRLVDLRKKRVPTPTPGKPTSEPEPATEPVAERPRPSRVTALLVAAIVLLTGIGGAEAYYLFRADDPVVSAERPVVVDELTVQSVVDQSAGAAEKIIAATSEDYDAQVDAATATMNDAFAEEYRETKADIKDEFVAAQTEVSAEVSAQGVVTASPEQVVALLFLTQTTTKAGDDLTVAQYRVTVTMSKTDDGWLVSALQTQ